MELVDQLLAILAGPNPGFASQQLREPGMGKTRSAGPGTLPVLQATVNQAGSVRIGLPQRAGRGPLGWLTSGLIGVPHLRSHPGADDPGCPAVLALRDSAGNRERILFRLFKATSRNLVGPSWIDVHRR